MNNHSSALNNLQFLKLGGSLITEKSKPYTARVKLIESIATEIAAYLRDTPEVKLLLGHGSGSFGHTAAQTQGTRQGVHNYEQWRGFAEVAAQAAALNHIVMEALHEAELPAVVFPPSAGAVAEDGMVVDWDIEVVRRALEADLLPVVYGDVAFDRTRGGTILATEDLFVHLASELKPGRILLAGEQRGVFADYPECTELIPEINPNNIIRVADALTGSAAVDVTGGMAGKVQAMLSLVERVNGIEVHIFSGQTPTDIRRALQGVRTGTHIAA
jgi:isopentenyl phosphate kinase